MNAAKKAGAGVVAALALAALHVMVDRPSYPDTSSPSTPLPPVPASVRGQAAAEPHMAYSYSRVSSGRAMIHASGEIGLHEADAFNAWTNSLPKEQQDSIRVGMTTLVLDSPGGIIGGARQMADWVRDNKIDTIVPNGSTCASACVLIWGAGYRKAAGMDSHVGVHSASSDLASNDDRIAQEALGTLAMARALAEENAPAAVIAAVTTTSSEDMHWLTAADVTLWGGVVTDEDGMPLGLK